MSSNWISAFTYLGFGITIDVREIFQFILNVFLALTLRVLEWFSSKDFGEPEESMLPNSTSPVSDRRIGLGEVTLTSLIGIQTHLLTTTYHSVNSLVNRYLRKLFIPILFNNVLEIQM